MAWLDTKNSVRDGDFDRRLRAATRHVTRCDPVVARIARDHGCFDVCTTRSAFQVMLETIISQQLSTKASASIYGRLRALMPRGVPRPSHVLVLNDAQLRTSGLSRSKAQYVRNAAVAFSSRRFGAAALAHLDDEGVIARLTEIKGVGEWSAHMFLIFALHRLDVFPIGDLGLRNAMKAQYRLRGAPRDQRLHRIADAWRPYRTVGTLYLWKSYDVD